MQTVFYSWQSDTRAAANRTLILDALEAAVGEIRNDESLAVEPVVDRDTLAVPGAPDIGATILRKIDESSAFVADVTIIGTTSDGRHTPNPNVMLELGYALRSLGDQRIVLVQNVALGTPEMLPFDLRQKRVLTYKSELDDTSRAEARGLLKSKMYQALNAILSQPTNGAEGEYPAELIVSHSEKNIRADNHDYQLQVHLKNNGTRAIREWHVDVEIPTKLLVPDLVQMPRVPERSNDKYTLMRITQDDHRAPIYPGDNKLVMTIEYHVDDEIFMRARELFQESIVATAYVHGELAAKEERLVRDMQNF